MQTKDLLDCSQDVLRAEKALEVQYEEYYEQLADQQSLSPEEQAGGLWSGSGRRPWTFWSGSRSA